MCVCACGCECAGGRVRAPDTQRSAHALHALHALPRDRALIGLSRARPDAAARGTIERRKGRERRTAGRTGVCAGWKRGRADPRAGCRRTGRATPSAARPCHADRRARRARGRAGPREENGVGTSAESSCTHARAGSVSKLSPGGLRVCTSVFVRRWRWRAPSPVLSGAIECDGVRVGKHRCCGDLTGMQPNAELDRNPHFSVQCSAVPCSAVPGAWRAVLCCWAPRVQRICRRKRGPADEISRAGGRAATTTGLPSPHAPYSLCPQQPHRLCPRPSHAWSTVLPLAETCPGRQTGERLGSRAIGRLPCVAVCAGALSPTQGALLDNPVFFLAFFSGVLCRAVLLCGNNRSGIGSARVSPGCSAFSGVEGGRLLHISHAALIFLLQFY